MRYIDVLGAVPDKWRHEKRIQEEDICMSIIGYTIKEWDFFSCSAYVS